MRLIRLLKRDLAREVGEWQAEGVISVDQAELICARYGVDLHDDSAHSFGYRLLVGLGYLFIGLALLILLGANWDQIPRMARMGSLITLTVGVNLFGILCYRAGKEAKAEALFFLGALTYGASIMLIAQIYHLGEHYPDGIYWWALGSLPAALLLKSRMIMLLATGLALIWFFVEAEMGYFPASMPLFLLALAWFVCYAKSSSTLFLALLAATLLWLEYALGWYLGGDYPFEINAEQLSLGAGFLVFCFALANWLVSRSGHHLKEYGLLLDLWTLRFGILLLLLFSFDDVWREYIGMASQSPLLNSAIILLFGVATLLLHQLSGATRRNAQAAAVAYLGLFLTALWWGGREITLWFQLADNLLLLGFGIWLIVYGISRAVSHYFYLGVGTLLITALVRYLDLVGDYIGASILFLVFAMILLFSARYWRVRNARTGESA